MLPFVQLAQFREIRPYVRFAHYTDFPLKVPSRYIRDHEFILVDKGRGVLYTESGSHAYEEGSLLMIPPGVLHSFRDEPEASGYAHWAIHFDWEPRSEEELLQIVGEEAGPIRSSDVLGEASRLSSVWLPNLVRMDDVGEEIRQRIKSVVEAFRVERPFRKLELQSAMLRLLLVLAAGLREGRLTYASLSDRKTKTEAKGRAEITDYVLRIHDAVRDNTDAGEIHNRWREEVFFSAPHFHRLFKEQTGLSPLEYATKLRMEKGARLLLGTDLPVKEISYACGYEDSKYFSRLFRQREGMSPSQYREHFLAGR
ncbi:AraC family transcriptional regulator [Cohnella hongkongensis]|uniref:AraC family transcriptional regulator n=1 Tax=Cohnella hongkongensis TaxID=178337 RepID=A0ABV9FJU8_9BACL